MRFTRWDQKSSTKETNEILKRLALYHCSQIKESLTRECLFTSITSNDILALCDYSPAYDELSVHDAAMVRQITAFYSKRCDTDLGIDKRRAAINSFIEAETLCRQTNDILEKKRSGKFSFSQTLKPYSYGLSVKSLLFLVIYLICRNSRSVSARVQRRKS